MGRPDNAGYLQSSCEIPIWTRFSTNCFDQVHDQAMESPQERISWFLTFGQHFCGSDFLAAIDDGRLLIDFVDNRHVYQYTGQTGFKDNGNFSKKTLQFIARGSEANTRGAGNAKWV